MAETEDTKEIPGSSASAEMRPVGTPVEPGEENFAEMFEESYTGERQVKEGAIVKGRVIEIRPDDERKSITIDAVELN